LNTAVENRVLVKIFVGFEISARIRIHLNESDEWKKAAVLGGRHPNHIVEIHFNEIDYIGRHLDTKMPTLKYIQAEAVRIRERLKELCPEINVDTLKINIFPQVFVS
jgi:hypothetical protein